MPKLPALKPDQVIKVLEKAGFSFIRQKESTEFMLKETLESQFLITIKI